MATRSAREALYHQLTEVLGHGPAETLMSYLPDERPATKADITELRGEIAGLREDFRTELRVFRGEVREDLRHTQGLLAAQTRTHVAASLGSAVTVAGLVFIAAQIV